MESKFGTNLSSDTTCTTMSSCVEFNAHFGAEFDADVKNSIEMNNLDCTSFVSDTKIEFITSSDSECSELDKNLKHNDDLSNLVFDDFNFVQRLGSGDIGTVYLVELRGGSGGGGSELFAAKVMDKEELAYRNKESRAGVEREILEMLDHPFLPSLYATLDCRKWSCLLTEFCPGGDLHVLRQRQPEKRFDEDAVRFYAAEVVAALEYLHMVGIIYRDLKPENVLVKHDGHIMLTDFDLSLKCDYTSLSTPTLVYDYSPPAPAPEPPADRNSADGRGRTRLFSLSSCILPNCVLPRGVPRLLRRRRRRVEHRRRGLITTPKIVAEPVEARSMSFVGTHEYLAPEIVSGEGHGSGVDWWTLGVLVYELLYGTTPFRGAEHEFTLANIVARGVEFPKEPAVSAGAKDLMSRLLNKEPTKRMGSTMGAAAIKDHPFFRGVNWSLLRCTKPPYIPTPFNRKALVSSDNDDHCHGNIDYF
ncbi:hypothetical protein ABFS83_06G088100 [Erythranthe nasuta]